MHYPVWMLSQMEPDAADSEPEQHWHFNGIDVNTGDWATTPADRTAALETIRDWDGARRVVAKQCWGGRGCW